MDTPCYYYQIRGDRLAAILKHHFDLNRENLSGLFTDLERFVDYSITDRPIRQKTISSSERTEPDKPRIVYGLFFYDRAYHYHKLKISRSNIPKAGFGVFALEEIPKGARGCYKGVNKVTGYAKNTYSWSVKNYDDDGNLIDDDDEEELYLVDAYDKNKSNWTRYVNCGPTRRTNNMEMDQHYDKIFYTAIKTIKTGDELFIDYGEDYRRDNLGIRNY